MAGFDDRRQPDGRRSVDREVEQWRGQITEQVHGHEGKLRAINGDLRQLRDAVVEQGVKVTSLSGQVREAREEIGDMVKELKASREREANERDEELNTIRAAQLKPRDLWLHVAFPLVVLVAGALILLALTGSVHG